MTDPTRSERKASAICVLVMLHEGGEITADELVENIQIIIGASSGRLVLTSMHDVTRDYLTESKAPPADGWDKWIATGRM